MSELNGNNTLALVIEDDQDAAAIFAEALQEAELKPEIIRDGQAALERLAEVTPVLIALDLHLPHVLGRDILRHIRADTGLSDTKIIIISADPLMADSLREEADLVLIKPVSYRQVRDLAARLHPAWKSGGDLDSL